MSTPEPMFETIHRQPRLSDRVTQAMLDSILASKIAPGDALPSERALAEQFGVSRTVIREAVRNLDARGVLDVQSGSGVRVANVDPSVVDDALQLFLWSSPVSFEKVHEVREMLEVQAARLAAGRAGEEDLARMRESLARLADRLPDVEAAATEDVEFHRHVARSTQNDLMLVLHDCLGSTLVQIRRQAMTQSTRAGADALAAHTAIFKAIAAHDADGAAEAMHFHLSQVRGALRDFDL
jgi:GntR family transcriptional repressor for pyruvate dehydrogenase complex